MWFFFALLFFISVGLGAPTPPSVSYIQGVENLNLQGGGNQERLGSFVLLNPEPASFHLNLSFANGCKLKRFGSNSSVVLTFIKVQTVADSSLKTWTRVADDCETSDFEIVFDKPAISTTYEIEILGSWTALGFNILAGRVWEAVTLTISNISY